MDMLGASSVSSAGGQGQSSDAQDTVTLISIFCRLSHFSLPGFFHEVGHLPPAAPRTHLSLLERDSSVPIRKTLGLHNLLPSLANIYENHIIKGGMNRRGPSLK